MDSNLFKTKSIEQLVSDAEHGGKGLKRSLTAWDLTLLGIGAIIGTGIFVLTGTAAANQAGPAITMSYLAAGLACAFAALCYAEFASMIPVAGSAYTYAYATLGELVAWMIGWDLILEYAVGSMTVAIGWSGYMQRLLAGVGIELPAAHGHGTADRRHQPAGDAHRAGDHGAAGDRRARIRTIQRRHGGDQAGRDRVLHRRRRTFVRPENWSPFAPYGWSGIMAAAAVVFFAYIGFDAVSTTAEEAKNPKRDLPIGIIASLVVCTVLYLAVAAILSGIVPVVQFRASADALPGVASVSPEESVRFLNAPVAYALNVISQDWAAYLVSAGAVAGITSVLLVMLMSQPRIFFAMSRDGLLPQGVSKVHPQVRHAVHHHDHHVRRRRAGRRADADSGRRRDDEHRDAVRLRRGLRGGVDAASQAARRASAIPGAVGPVFPILGILSCAYLMLSLPVITWVRFLVWLDIGFIIYWFYGRTHSPLADNRTSRSDAPRCRALGQLRHRVRVCSRCSTASACSCSDCSPSSASPTRRQRNGAS